MKSQTVRNIVIAVLTANAAGAVLAQAAGAGADFNRRERAVIKEQTRLEAYDKPVRVDPIGNALIGGGVNTAMKGIAAGVQSVVTGATFGTGVQQAREKK